MYGCLDFVKSCCEVLNIELDQELQDIVDLINVESAMLEFEVEYKVSMRKRTIVYHYLDLRFSGSLVYYIALKPESQTGEKEIIVSSKINNKIVCKDSKQILDALEDLRKTMCCLKDDENDYVERF